MRYKVVEDPRVQRKTGSLFVRERARYLDIKKDAMVTLIEHGAVAIE